MRTRALDDPLTQDILRPSSLAEYGYTTIAACAFASSTTPLLSAHATSAEEILRNVTTSLTKVCVANNCQMNDGPWCRKNRGKPTRRSRKTPLKLRLSSLTTTQFSLIRHIISPSTPDQAYRTTYTIFGAT